MTVWYESNNGSGWCAGERYSIDEPCVTVMARGMGGDALNHWRLCDDGKPMVMKPMKDKPPYRVPTMAEIRELSWNGFNVVSTFSGCGGSCLGYRMAGFRVLWASEFIPAAQETYKANHPDSILDTRDIREVDAASIRKAIGKKTTIHIMDGSPPCASFSTAGKREAGWGKVKKHSDKEQRTDDLFYEYARLLKDLQPLTFVAENVSGLVKGTAKGYFIAILAALKECGYRVACRILDAKWLGVPQSRQRTIFVGVREDLKADPVHPSPLPYLYTVRDALPWITKVVQDPKGQFDVQTVTNAPCMAVTVTGRAHITVESKRLPEVTDWEPSPDGNAQRRKFTIQELKRICGFPDDFILTGTYAQQWERLGRAVPPVMMSHIAGTVRDKILRAI